MNVYSPSQTSTFVRCPTKWFLSRQGWGSKWLAKSKVAMLMGSGFHAWAEQYYKSNRENKDPKIAIDLFNTELQATLDSGKLPVPDAEEQALKAAGLLTTLTGMYAKADPIPLTWTITDIESVVDEGNSRIDLGGFDQNGSRWYWDFKTTGYCREGDVSARFQDYAYSWQMMHYAKSYSDHVKEQVRRYYICLVIFGPYPGIRVQDYTVDAQTYEWWRRSAQRYWSEIDTYERILKEHPDPYDTAQKFLSMATEHFDRWGKCEYMDACFLYKLDPELIRHGYLQIERKKA